MATIECENNISKIEVTNSTCTLNNQTRKAHVKQQSPTRFGMYAPILNVQIIM